MRLTSILLAGALAAAAFAPAQAATLVNQGFETGDLTGWTATPGLVEVVTEADDAIGAPPFGQHYQPTENDYFARLTAGVDLDEYTLLTQAFTLTQAAKLNLSVAFLAFDYLPYNDDAFVRVRQGATVFNLFTSDIAQVGDYGHTDWLAVSTLLQAGDYVLEAGVRDVVDFGGSSQLLLDGVNLTAAPVPEPSTWLMMIGGLGVVGSMLRRGRGARLAGGVVGA